MTKILWIVSLVMILCLLLICGLAYCYWSYEKDVRPAWLEVAIRITLVINGILSVMALWLVESLP